MTALETPQSRALDPRLYIDPLTLEREQEAVFARSWQLAGHVADVAEPGRYLTARVGAESVLVVRGEDGELRAFRNVCRHRAARLREGRGECGKALRCPYHGFTYRTDGRLIGVPEGRGFPGLDKAALSLMPARVECFSGLVFVTLDLEAAPLADGLEGLAEKLAPYGIERLTRFSESTAAPPAQVATHDASETVDSVWTTPEAALSRYAAGDAYLMFPTTRNLETLAHFDTVGQLLEAARTIGPAPRTAPARLPAKIGAMRLQPPSRPESPCLT